MKLKRRGYILFVYWAGKKPYFEADEFCDNISELFRKWNNHWDDKWDVIERHKYHYFYLDIAKNKYIPLKKWKDDVNREDRFNSSHETVISTKTF